MLTHDPCVLSLVPQSLILTPSSLLPPLPRREELPLGAHGALDTGLGTAAAGLAECIIERYRTRVLEVENGFSLSARGVGGGYRLTGQPIKVDMKPHIADLPAFCARLFSAINPFRLAGIPRRVGDDHFLVAAVDLHTGQTLRFELSPDRIIVFLPAGTCGNTLLRFVTNLQRHHSRLVRAPQLGWG